MWTYWKSKDPPPPETPPARYEITYEKWRSTVDGRVVAVRLCDGRPSGIRWQMPGERLSWRDLPLLEYEGGGCCLSLDWVTHNRAEFELMPRPAPGEEEEER